MDRRRGGLGQVEEKAAIASRLRSIRLEIYGKQGDAEVAGKLGLPVRTWQNYEKGVTIPGEVMLRYLELTGAEPLWLLSGAGARFRPTPPAASADPGP